MPISSDLYIKYLDTQKAGIVKVVTPNQWHARRGNYDDSERVIPADSLNFHTPRSSVPRNWSSISSGKQRFQKIKIASMKLSLQETRFLGYESSTYLQAPLAHSLAHGVFISWSRVSPQLIMSKSRAWFSQESIHR